VSVVVWWDIFLPAAVVEAFKAPWTAPEWEPPVTLDER
jgi:hypothetical protein